LRHTQIFISAHVRDRNFTHVHDIIIIGGGDMHVTSYEHKRSCIYVIFIFLFSHKIDMYFTQANNVYHVFTVSIKSSTRQNDPVKKILLAAIEYVEHIFNSEKGMYIGNKSNSITCIDVKHIAHSM
jgi:hypothetical protein